MTTATLEKDKPAAPAAALADAGASPRAQVRPMQSRPLVVGRDFGTNKSCVLAGSTGTDDIVTSKIVPTVVGYVKDGIVDGIIAGNASVIFGEDALRNGLHVNLVAPMEEGVIVRADTARAFLQHIRSLIDAAGSAEIRAVVGVPANAGGPARDVMRSCALGIFDRILLIPEPFLAALGYRDDSRVGQANYVDPVTNSLFVDIGGGTSDLCLVQGYFPTRDDQISLPFAGDTIDRLLLDELERTYPNHGLSLLKVREIKEASAYVGPVRKPLDVKVVIGGKGHTLDLGEAIGRAGNALIDKIYPALTTLIQRASSDSVVTLLQNIIITGGGSQIRGIDTVLQKRLGDDGFESPKVRLAGHDYKRYVAIGALKAARAAKEHQWQHLLG